MSFVDPFRGLQGNTPNNSTIQERAILDVPPDQKNFFYYAMLSVYLATLMLSAVVNLTITFALIHGRKIFIARPFYILLAQIVLANLLNILSNFVCNVPVATFLSSNQSKVFIETITYTVMGLFDTLADHVIQLLVLIVAIHRNFMFIIPKIGHRIFEGVPLVVIIIVVWILSISTSSFITYKSCYFQYFQKSSSDVYGNVILIEEQKFKFICNISGLIRPQNIDEEMGNGVLLAIMTEKISFPVVIFICYLMIAIKFFFVKKTTKRNYGEGEILRQGAFIFVVFETATVVNYIIYSTPLSTGIVFLAKRMVATADLMAGLLSPLFIILTSTDIKKILFRCGKRQERKIEPIVLLNLPGLQGSHMDRSQRRLSALPRSSIVNIDL